MRKELPDAVLAPGDDGFDAACAGFQTAYRHRPSAVVRADGSETVAAAVAHAADHGLSVAVQATGHGLSVPAEGGVLISTAGLRGVTVDAGARTARIAPGTRFSEIIEAAARYGLAPLNGSAPDVGAVGYVLGGGLGLLGRQFGYAADHVTSVDVVTADARVRHVTADSDADLFWALRGAGTNFGVVTGMEIGLVPVSRMYGGELVFDLARVPGILEVYRQWTGTLPEELTSSVSLVAYPDLPMLPDRLRGRHLAQVRIAYTGDSRRGEELTAPLREAGPRQSDSVAEMPYTECGSIHDDPPLPHAYLGDNVLLREFGAEDAAAVLRGAGPGSGVPCVVEIRHLGGALGRAPLVPNAVGHRDAHYLLRTLTPLQFADPDEARAAHRQLLGAVGGVREASVGRFHNFVYGGCEDGGAHRPADDLWEPADHGRLSELKAALDPANMFRCNRNVRLA
ncbi:hypothetical protein QR77_16300 [Streptomyces sp. 150FB]|nr:hypothetical protein QR77_16300 [Streptomyces sp. 150FB]